MKTMYITSGSKKHQTAVRCSFDEDWIIREQANSNVRGGDAGEWGVRRNSGTALDNVSFSISMITDNARTDLSNWNRRPQHPTHIPHLLLSQHPPLSCRGWRGCNSDTICAPSRILDGDVTIVTIYSPSTRSSYY